MRDYREKEVNGYICDITKIKNMVKPCKVTVRMTSDEKGQSLSLSAYNIQIGIPLEAVRDIIEVVDNSITERG